MKTVVFLPLIRAEQLRRTLFSVLAVCFVAALATTRAASPSLHPLSQGMWPALPPGIARDVKVVGDYAYLALDFSGLAVVDVRDPANCVRVGGYDTSGSATGVAVAGN